MVDGEAFRELIGGHSEWLLVREGGRSFPVKAEELEIEPGENKTLFIFPDDTGFHTFRLRGFEIEEGEVVAELSGQFGKGVEKVRMIPRTEASELTASITLARMQKAYEIGRMITQAYPETRVDRISLNTGNGRLAQVLFSRAGRHLGSLADVTGTVTAEALLATAMLWHERLGNRRKKPVSEIRLIAERPAARNLQKLHALLNARWREIITIEEISRKADPPMLRELPKRNLSDLWREKAKKIVLPSSSGGSGLAKAVTAMSPENIDSVFSKQGETFRFNGLPFARSRSMMGREMSWFGIGKQRRLLTTENASGLRDLVSELELYRVQHNQSSRHNYYRVASEAWLESKLRRNIALLDANLILAPIYNQFRSANDKIDLLALRRDGRLVIIEVKTKPDREMVLQAADYWRKIELQRRRGVLAAADLFDKREILDKPALVYLVAPALSFHRDFRFFAGAIMPVIEMWRFELHERWRDGVKVIGRVERPQPLDLL